MRATLLLLVAVAVGAPATGHAAGGRVAVAWNDFGAGSGRVRAMSSGAPWSFVSEPLEVGLDPVLHVALDRLYVLSRDEESIKVINPDTWTVERGYRLGPGGDLVDIAVVDAKTAYVTRRSSTHLLRVDLDSGATEEVLDLSFLADADGIPDSGRMALDEGRLFVQIQRLNGDDARGYVPPAFLAVMDVATEQLIDVDAARPGVQTIELIGTFPKMKMQVVPESRRMLVSATGGFFDEGGLESIDLDTLQSQGLVIRESDGLTGADLGPFVMISADRGYLSFTTDLTLSSHLVGFSLSRGVMPGEFHVDLDYFAPTIEFEPVARTIFFPHSIGPENGIHVFDAETGGRLTSEVIATNGPPTDVVLVRPVPEPSTMGLCIAALMSMIRRSQKRRATRGRTN